MRLRKMAFLVLSSSFVPNIRMMLSSVVLVTCAVHAAYAQLLPDGSVHVVPDIQLGIDDAGFDTTADLYCSTDSEAIGSESPVVLLYPGFAGPKDEYIAIASSLAEAGYTLMVLQQLVPPLENPPPGIPVPTEPVNIITATSTAVALQWLETGFNTVAGGEGGYGEQGVPCAAPDLSRVLLVGHSWGSSVARSVLKGGQSVTIEVLGLPSVAIPVYPQILGAFLSGTGEINALAFGPPALPQQKIFIGQGDVDFELVGGLNATEYDVLLEVQGLDHYSIADSVFTPNSTAPLTDRPKDEQEQISAELAVGALNAMLCGAAEDGSAETPSYIIQTDIGTTGDPEDLTAWLSWLPA